MQLVTTLLTDALGLVRGEPYVGAGRNYAWVAQHRGIIVAEVVNAAEELAEITLELGDWRAAEWAARQGLRAFPCDERLYRVLMRAAHASGSVSGVHRVFDELSHHAGKFYYGRYDIKTSSIEDLKQGKNFQIIEFNGCGAEPNHIYDCGMSIWRAYGVILQHWKALFHISRYNHRNGTPYWSFKRGWNFLKESRKHFKMLEKYD